MEKTMDKIVALAKSRGFVYPGSEIYGYNMQRVLYKQREVAF